MGKAWKPNMCGQGIKDLKENGKGNYLWHRQQGFRKLERN